jgi:membrane protease YdiL (CAAX protease family)
VLMLAKLPVFGKYISPRMQGLHADNLGKNIFWGICGFFANIPIAAITLILSMSLMQHLPEPTHPVAEQMAAGVTWTEFFVILMAASVAAPIIEEICFRGTLLPAMASALRSVPWAIILSSLIFAAIHPQGIVMWLPLAGVGAIAAMLTYQTRSLIPAIVLHALHNGVILSAAMLVSQAL